MKKYLLMITPLLILLFEIAFKIGVISTNIKIPDIIKNRVKASTFEPTSSFFYFNGSNTALNYSNVYDLYYKSIDSADSPIYYFSMVQGALVNANAGPIVPSGAQYAIFRGVIKQDTAFEHHIECERITSNGCEAWNLYDQYIFSLQLGQYDGGYPTSSCELSIYKWGDSVSDNGVSFIAKCPLYKNTTRLQYIRFNFNNYTLNQDIGLGIYLESFEIDNSSQIITEQQHTNDAISNQTQQQQENYNNMMNTNQTYLDEQNTNIRGVNETQEYENAEEQLIQSVDTNTSILDGIIINPAASAYIWDIVGGLRSMNPAIILLMTSVLGLGVVKLILNR